MGTKTRKIDFSCRRFGKMADKYYNEGNYVSALRFAYKQLHLYGGDADIYARLADIYEGMSLNGSALKWWFRLLDIADEEDLPDVYEGIAINYLNLGNEGQAAYYYNRLIDADDNLPEETKLDIAAAFSTKKRDKFRFVYPPKLADYSNEVSLGSKALKAGDCARAISMLDKVEKGSKEYVSAKEMQAVSYLLAGQADVAETICLDLLQDAPDNVRVKATLAAVYLEEGKTEESRLLAQELSRQDLEDTDDLYKVATICCENGLHEEAYQKFCLLDKKLPFDGRMLYFKGVSAYKSGRVGAAEKVFDELCSVYPDAEVTKYYLNRIRAFREGEQGAPELTYFYHIPQEERDYRCKTLLHISGCAKDEAQIFGLLALHDGYLQWCFDEMDGGDHDLQYLALITAVHIRADEFIEDILLDPEVADVLKIETLRMLLERNEDKQIGIVLCNIYRKVDLLHISIGRKRRKRFMDAYAKIASKFFVIADDYGVKIKHAAEQLYRCLETKERFDLANSSDDCACAIYLLSGLKELGNDVTRIAVAFDANVEKVNELLGVALDREDVGRNENGTLEEEQR